MRFHHFRNFGKFISSGVVKIANKRSAHGLFEYVTQNTPDAPPECTPMRARYPELPRIFPIYLVHLRLDCDPARPDLFVDGDGVQVGHSEGTRHLNCEQFT